MLGTELQSVSCAAGSVSHEVPKSEMRQQSGAGCGSDRIYPTRCCTAAHIHFHLLLGAN